jgi:hypothetical protein
VLSLEGPAIVASQDCHRDHVRPHSLQLPEDQSHPGFQSQVFAGQNVEIKQVGDELGPAPSWTMLGWRGIRNKSTNTYLIEIPI